MKSPLLVVTEFADFECPACMRFALQHWPEVRRRFGDSVALRFRHWPQPYHLFARDAAVASICAKEQGRFAQMRDLLYEKQSEIGRTSFESFARESGVRNLGRFRDCILEIAPQRIVEIDSRAAEEVGAIGTPTLVIKGVSYRLRADITWLPRVIDSLLAPIRDSISRARRGRS